MQFKIGIKKLLKSMLLVSSLATSLTCAEPNIWVASYKAQIGIVDVATGSVKLILNQGYIYFDIAFDANGNLYGVDPAKLYSINKATGWGTQIGSLGLSSLGGSLAFSPTGTLYLLANDMPSVLYTVNTETGQATVEFNTGYSFAQDLVFFNGSLYFTNPFSLFLLNLSDQSTTRIGSFGASITKLVAADNGVLYGIDKNNVYSIDTATGAATLVATYANALSHVSGAAFYSGPTACLLNWAENNYTDLFSPASSSVLSSSPYYYRHYPATNAYVGISSNDDHVYYMGSDGKLQNEGSLSYWLPKAGCATIPPPEIECVFNWVQRKYPTLFSPAQSASLASTPYTYYRNYSATNTVLRISSASNHVSYQDSNGTLQDVGLLSNWLTTAYCW